MQDYHPDLKKLRSYWEFSNICQFFLLFGAAYDIDFETDDFEAALIRQDKDIILSYMIKLCRNLESGRFANSSNWESILKKEYIKEEGQLPIKIDLEKDFFDYTIYQQVVLIQFLCDLQFRGSSEKLRQAAGDENYAEWRVEPIGEDKKGNIYFLFDDNRLYAQSLKAHPPKSSNTKAIKKLREKERQLLRDGESNDETWAPVCITLDDWEKFSTKFESSRSQVEKRFFNTLTEDVLPQVIPQLKSKLRVIKKMAALQQMVPKRSSRLQEKEKQKKELEEQKKKENLINALKNEPTSSIVKNHPSMNTREMRAKRRALVNSGRNEELLKIQEETIKGTLGDVKINDEEIIDITDDFYFDCICGKRGKNIDDGSMQICCERCNVWQHTLCQDLKGSDGLPLKSYDDIEFYCRKCSGNTNPLSSTSTENLKTILSLKSFKDSDSTDGPNDIEVELTENNAQCSFDNEKSNTPPHETNKDTNGMYEDKQKYSSRSSIRVDGIKNDSDIKTLGTYINNIEPNKVNNLNLSIKSSNNIQSEMDAFNGSVLLNRSDRGLENPIANNLPSNSIELTKLNQSAIPTMTPDEAATILSGLSKAGSHMITSSSSSILPTARSKSPKLALNSQNANVVIGIKRNGVSCRSPSPKISRSNESSS